MKFSASHETDALKRKNVLMKLCRTENKVLNVQDRDGAWDLQENSLHDSLKLHAKIVASWDISSKLIKGWQSQWQHWLAKDLLLPPTIAQKKANTIIGAQQNVGSTGQHFSTFRLWVTWSVIRIEEKSKFVDSLTECNENILQVLKHDSWVRHGEIVNWKTKETKGRKVNRKWHLSRHRRGVVFKSFLSLGTGNSTKLMWEMQQVITSTPEKLSLWKTITELRLSAEDSRWHYRHH